MMDGLFFKAFGSLVLIVILIFTLLYLLKKYVYRDQSFGKNANNFSVLGHLILQPKKFIYIVKFFDKIMILGVSENNLNLLSEINDPESVAQIESSLHSKISVGKKTFLEYLKSNIGIKS